MAKLLKEAVQEEAEAEGPNGVKEMISKAKLFIGSKEFKEAPKCTPPCVARCLRHPCQMVKAARGAAQALKKGWIKAQ
jgi:hypothetical protein